MKSNGWKKFRVGDVALINELAINGSFPHSHIEYIDVASVNNRQIDQAQLLELKNAPSRAKRIVRNNDILISTVRPNLKHFAFVKDAKENTIASTGFAVISPKTINPRFLYYWLTTDSYTDYLAQVADTQTTTFPAFNPDIIKNTVLSAPENLDNQDRIAAVLASLDDKIELNHKINQTLEQIAQVIFKHWFIDFEFPDDQGQPYKSSDGEMRKSELGEIPKDWNIKQIKDCGDVVCGKTPPTGDKENYGDDVPFITIPDMRHKTFAIETERKLSTKGANLQKGKELPSLAICVSCIATPGLVTLTSDVSHTNQQINSIICDVQTSPYFLYLAMKEKSEEIKNKGLGGTATLNLNTGDFAKILLITPDDNSMTAFHVLVKPLFDMILEKSEEIIRISQIRDLLLPKLMSGEIKFNG